MWWLQFKNQKKIEKLAPPMIAFRATGTMTTQAADPGKSHHVIKVAWNSAGQTFPL